MKKIFAVGLTLLSLHANANVNVFNVQNEIKKQNANWMAKSTSVSGLSDFEVKRMLGSKDMPNGDELFYDRSKGNESLDWRNVSGLNWLGPVMNQGNCGSCVAFASIATLEARYRIASGQIWANPTFSPQHLFSCGGGACNFGWFASEAADSLKEDGVLDNACAPYSAGSTGVDVACKDIQCPDQNRRLYKIANFSTPSNYGGNAESVKAALKYGPLLTTMVVYDDFLTYAGGIYKHVTGKKAGGHAISLVGFNDLERYWVIRNSWGDDWGEGGFA
ncbi:MAG: C1 family peptidase, partial [Bacteriovorax sp.]